MSNAQRGSLIFLSLSDLDAFRLAGLEGFLMGNDGHSTGLSHMLQRTAPGKQLLAVGGKNLSALQTQVSWKAFVRNYDKRRFDRGEYRRAVRTDVAAVQARYEALREKLAAQTWRQDAFRQELLLAAEGVCLMAELNAKIMGEDCVRCTDTEGWLAKFGSSWLKSSKPSELWRIEEVFRWCEAWRA